MFYFESNGGFNLTICVFMLNFPCELPNKAFRFSFKVLYHYFIDKTMQKAYNIRCTFLETRDPDYVKLLQLCFFVPLLALLLPTPATLAPP